MSCDQCNGCKPIKKANQKRLQSKRSRNDTRSKADATIALLGQPNSGKSTLFNGLTGSHQHVGNWPGKTVEQKHGTFAHNGKIFEVVDLPGAYGLGAGSPEEEVTRDYIASGEADAVVVFADASQLERSLYMLASYAGCDTPALLALNMMDVAQEQGKQIDVPLLQQRLGIPVIPLVASDRKSYDNFYNALDRAIGKEGEPSARALATHDIKVAAVPSGSDQSTQEMTAARFSWIESLLDGAVTKPASDEALSKFDRIAIGSRWSKPLAALMILVGFILAFIPALPIMGIGGMVSSLGMVVASALTSTGVPEVVGSLLSGVVFNSLPPARLSDDDSARRRYSFHALPIA